MLLRSLEPRVSLKTTGQLLTTHGYVSYQSARSGAPLCVGQTTGQPGLREHRMKGASGLQTVGLTPDLALSLISFSISGCYLGASVSSSESRRSGLFCSTGQRVCQAIITSNASTSPELSINEQNEVIKQNGHRKARRAAPPGCGETSDTCVHRCWLLAPISQVPRSVPYIQSQLYTHSPLVGGTVRGCIPSGHGETGDLGCSVSPGQPLASG